ncbi:hypothetical protein MMPV_009831 [Pyropia vietnamensis]
MFLLARAPYAGAVDKAAILSAKPPRQLSAFGFFDDLAAQHPAAGVLAFAPASMLFSDHARKLRFAFVPPGASAAYDAREAFAFPVGSALIKTFYYPARAGEGEAGRRLIETRLLLRQEKGWNAWAYIWREDGSDADLNIAGAKLPLEIEVPGGRSVAFDYAVPNKNQCKGCHEVAGAITPIGPRAAHLNHVFDYGGGEAANQLQRWTELGMLDGAPPIQQAPSLPDFRDKSAPLDARARAWLDINCAHCHRAEGPASNTGLYLTWHEADARKLGVGKRPVAAGRGAGDNLFVLVPGRPEESILFTRMDSTEPGVMMPELGRRLADQEAVALIGAWIESLR